MKKIISFSLYGNNSMYTIGAFCNAELAKIIYPGWICRFYCGESISKEIVDALKKYDNVEVVSMKEDMSYSYMMWRFLPVDDDDVTIMLCRDADSRLSYREKSCVDIFLESDKLLHSIQDHGLHDNIMGGMWGMKKNDRIIISDLIKKWNGGLGYFSDQAFIRNVIKPIYSDSYLVHCSHYLKNFPVDKKNDFFVGQIFSDNNGKPYDHVFY